MYRRDLPHWSPDGAALFVTWRLLGTLPRHQKWEPDVTSEGRAFRNMDRQLDTATFGPTCLKEPQIGECVAEIIEAAEETRKLCEHSFVVMPNHVHILITPKRPLCEITKWIKGTSARRANQLLKRTGRPFWQDESFDHWVRNQAEFDQIGRYIIFNPVQAGLVMEPSQWPFSSASRRAQPERSDITG